MPDPALYAGREQTYIKHVILNRYLQKLAYKVGSWCGTLNYIDCFAGPWKHTSDDLRDTSPFIAIRELLLACKGLRDHDRNCPVIRCLFIEKDPTAHRLLADRVREEQGVEAHAIQGEFEDQIEIIQEFIRNSPDGRSFSFFFVDPTGWTGYALDVLRPLLSIDNVEVIVNFMTQFVSRFIDRDDSEHVEAFNRLFGSTDYRRRWQDLEPGPDREDEIVKAYAERLKEAGGFKFVAPSIVLEPVAKRTLFHLIYATRSIHGLRVFRNDAERPAFQEQQRARVRAFERKTGQGLLFDGDDYSASLRDRYRDKATTHLMELISTRPRIAMDELEAEALLFPMMSTQELKLWLVELQKQKVIAFEGLDSKARIPQVGKGHYINLRVPPSSGS